MSSHTENETTLQPKRGNGGSYVIEDHAQAAETASPGDGSAPAAANAQENSTKKGKGN